MAPTVFSIDPRRKKPFWVIFAARRATLVERVEFALHRRGVWRIEVEIRVCHPT
jgi:hypothetical protein